MATIAVDFETFYRTNRTPSVKKQGNWRYTHDPEFEVLLIAVTDGRESWCGPVAEFNWEALRGHTLISHNAGFDRAVYSFLVEIGVAPAGLDTDWHCSANLTAWAGNRRSLKDAAEYWLGEKVDKSAREDLADHTLAQLKAKPALYDATIRYAHMDGIQCLRLWEKLQPSWPYVERRLSQLTIEQNARGVAIDEVRLFEDIAQLESAIWFNEKALPWVGSGASPESRTSLHKMCRMVGIPCPPVKKDDEEGAIIWEHTYHPQFEWARRFSEHRSLTKLLSSLKTIEDRIRPDGRFDFALLYCGAHTRRWSGSAGFNMQNMRAKPLVLDSRNGLVITSSEHDKAKKSKTVPDYWYPVDQRALFVPAPGKKMVSVDLAQIEPRVLAWVTGNTAMLERVAAGESVYEAYARVTKKPAGDYLWSESSELKVADPLLYKAVKIQVLQLGYGSGWKKFLSQALENDVQMDEAQAIATVENFRAGNPGIIKLWKDLDGAFRFCATSPERRMEIPLPNGQSLRYEQIRKTLKGIRKDEKTGEPIKEFGWSALIDARRRKHFYGGMFTENLIQSISRDVMAEGMLRLEDMGLLKTLWSVHDEVVGEHDTPDIKEIEHVMAQNPEWLQGCPLGAEAQLLAHYTK